LPASLALAAAGMDFHADTLADPELVDVWSELLSPCPYIRGRA